MGCRAAVPDGQLRGPPAMRATDGLAPGCRQPRICTNPLDALRYQRSSGAAHAARAKGASCTAARLIHMGVWRDPSQPGLKKRTRSATAFGHWNWKPAAQAAVDVVCSLDAGPLMGIFPGKDVIDGPEALLENRRITVLLAAPLWCFAPTRVLGDVRGHAGIEDRLAVSPAIVDASLSNWS